MQLQAQRAFSPVTNAQQHGALIQHKPLPKCYVIGGVSGSGKRCAGSFKATVCLPCLHAQFLMRNTALLGVCWPPGFAVLSTRETTITPKATKVISFTALSYR